ncbi:hypothetical protein J9303_20440, partial [Bacillaceae bacterium Marseille-Q3522]|nr:hypothetical protein [Bacillaceae bacterium Marseille-Q3522]
MKYIIKINHTSSNTISLHSKDIEKFSLYGIKTIMISIGAIHKEVTITTHHQEEYCLYISSDLFANFTLPDFLPYELRIEKG